MDFSVVSIYLSVDAGGDRGPVQPSREWVEVCRTVGESGRVVQEVCGVKTLGSKRCFEPSPFFTQCLLIDPSSALLESWWWLPN